MLSLKFDHSLHISPEKLSHNLSWSERSYTDFLLLVKADLLKLLDNETKSLLHHRLERILQLEPKPSTIPPYKRISTLSNKITNREGTNQDLAVRSQRLFKIVSIQNSSQIMRRSQSVLITRTRSSEGILLANIWSTLLDHK